MNWRYLSVSADRLPRWWAKFTTDHPDVEVSVVDGGVELHSSNGSVARFRGWYPVSALPAGADADRSEPDQLSDTSRRDEPLSARTTANDLEELRSQLVQMPEHIALVLVRRGGFSIGAVVDGQLIAHKSGTRYVQSRTAAGGWSQQRFARRRANQADELAGAAADHAARVLKPVLIRIASGFEHARVGLATGGDEALVAQVLADPRLHPLARVTRREFPDVHEPRHQVLLDVVRDCAAVRIAVHNP